MGRWILLLLTLLLTGPRAEGAVQCGDDVGGQDVPCGCGDVVVSDLRLGDDPALAEPCANDGLVVDAREAGQGLTIDLQGRTLRGQGRGTGILVLYGGPGGARIVSTGGEGSVDGFEDGIIGRGNDAIALVEHLSVRRSRRDGLRLHGNDYAVRATEVSDAGRDGFSLNGNRYRLELTRASNSGRFGYFIMGTEGELGTPGKGLAAANSAKAGFALMGADHRLTDCQAVGNREDGLHLMGMRHQLVECTAEANWGDGINGAGSGWWVIGNRATDNGNDGIIIRGAGVVDGGRNRGSGNRGERRDRHAVQCEIGGAACGE